MSRKFFVLLVSVDIFFILAHLAWGGNRWWNLDAEYNLPTYYQGIKAIVIGLWLMRMNGYKLLGGITAYIGLDEILTIHEKTEYYLRVFFPDITTDVILAAKSLGYRSVSWIVLLSPALLAGGIYFLELIKKLPDEKKNILIISVLFFGFAILAEIVNTQSRIPGNVYQQLVALEEGCELFGVTNLLRLADTS